MKNAAVNNLTAKIAALIVALVLWVTVTNEQNPPIEASYPVALEVRNAAQSMIIMDAPEAIRVKVRGPRSQLAGLNGKDIKAFIDVKGLPDGRNSLVPQIVLPQNLELVETYPEKVAIRIDAEASNKFPVEVKVIGTLPAGMVVAKLTPQVVQAVVDGPKSFLELVDKVIVLVDLKDKKADFEVESQARVYGKDGKEVDGVRVAPEKIKVNVSLGQEVARKLVDIKPLINGQLPAGTVLKSLVTEPDKVEITGPRELVDKVEFLYTEPVVISVINKDSSFEMRLQPRDGLAMSQASVLVNIKVVPGMPR